MSTALVASEVDREVGRLALERLEEECRRRGIDSADLYLHIYNEDIFVGAGIHMGDCMVVDKNARPDIGDFTILTSGNKMQLVWIIGKGAFGNDIVATKYIKYPVAKELLDRRYTGKAIALLRGNDMTHL